jgi:hypothetical protein
MQGTRIFVLLAFTVVLSLAQSSSTCRFLYDFEVCGRLNPDNSVTVNISAASELVDEFLLNPFVPEHTSQVIIGDDQLNGTFTYFPPDDIDIGVLWGNITTLQFHAPETYYNGGVLFFGGNYVDSLNGTDIGFVNIRWFFNRNNLEVFLTIEEELMDAFVLAKNYQVANFSIQFGQMGDMTNVTGQATLSFNEKENWVLAANFDYCSPVHGCSNFNGTLTVINPNKF